jgi:2-methylisocitrate lyase-like PEP mutase family enzyme
MVPGGKTPVVKTSELERMGYRIAIFPAVCMAAAIPAMERALARLRDRDGDADGGSPLGPMDIFRKVGFDWWHEVERRFAGPA